MNSMSMINRIFKFKRKIIEEPLIISTKLINQRFRKIELIHYKNGQFIIEEIALHKFNTVDTNINYSNKADQTILPNETKLFNFSLPVFEKIFKEEDFKRLEYFIKTDFGSIKCTENMVAFGFNECAIVLEVDGDTIIHIWLAGKTNNEKYKKKLKQILLILGNKFDLFGMNWISMRYFFLFSPDDVNDFIRINM